MQQYIFTNGGKAKLKERSYNIILGSKSRRICMQSDYAKKSVCLSSTLFIEETSSVGDEKGVFIIWFVDLCIVNISHMYESLF